METKREERLLSLDTLRGFDMLFIMGFAPLVVALNRCYPTAVGDWLAGQMSHTAWHGFTQHDLIFPLFLFIAGISFPFSLAKQRSRGVPDRRIGLRVLRRGVTLVVLGMVYNGLLQFDFADLRVASVLGRIGVAWMVGAWIYMRLPKRLQYGLIVFILVVYWLLLAFVPAPDAPGASPFSPEGNLAGYIDRILLPGRLNDGCHDKGLGRDLLNTRNGPLGIAKARNIGQGKTVVGLFALKNEGIVDKLHGQIGREHHAHHRVVLVLHIDYLFQGIGVQHKIQA